MSKFNKTEADNLEFTDTERTPQRQALPLTVRIPKTPISCPPVSPLTRIITSSDNVSSPGRRILSFEFDESVNEKLLYHVAQTVTEAAERVKVEEEEPVPVIKLQAPPKGKLKRQLSSDSDSHSSTSAASSFTSPSKNNSSLIGQNSRQSLSFGRRVSDVTINQNVPRNRSDSFSHLQRTPERYLSEIATKNSPKRLKAGSGTILSPGNRSQLDNNCSPGVLPFDISFRSNDDQSPSCTPKPILNSTPNFDRYSSQEQQNKPEGRNDSELAYYPAHTTLPSGSRQREQKGTSYYESHRQESSSIYNPYTQDVPGRAIVPQNEHSSHEAYHKQFGNDAKPGKLTTELTRKLSGNTEPTFFIFPNVSSKAQLSMDDAGKATSTYSEKDLSQKSQISLPRNSEAYPNRPTIPDTADEVDGLGHPMEIDNQQSIFASRTPFGSHLGQQRHNQTTWAHQDGGMFASSRAGAFSSPIENTTHSFGHGSFSTHPTTSFPSGNPFSFHMSGMHQDDLNDKNSASKTSCRRPFQQVPQEIGSRIFSGNNRHIQKVSDHFEYPNQHAFDRNQLDDFDSGGFSKQSLSSRNPSCETLSRERNRNERIVIEPEEILDISEPDDVVHIQDGHRAENSQREMYRCGQPLNFWGSQKSEMDQNNNNSSRFYIGNSNSQYIVQTEASRNLSYSFSLDELSGSGSSNDSMNCDDAFDDEYSNSNECLSKGSTDCIPLESYRSHHRQRCDEMDGVGLHVKNKNAETSSREKIRETDSGRKARALLSQEDVKVHKLTPEIMASGKTIGSGQKRAGKADTQSRLHERPNDTSHSLGEASFEKRHAHETHGGHRSTHESVDQDNTYRGGSESTLSTKVGNTSRSLSFNPSSTPTKDNVGIDCQNIYGMQSVHPYGVYPGDAYFDASPKYGNIYPVGPFGSQATVEDFGHNSQKKCGIRSESNVGSNPGDNLGHLSVSSNFQRSSNDKGKLDHKTKRPENPGFTFGYYEAGDQRQSIASEKRGHANHRVSPYSKNKFRDTRRRHIVDDMDDYQDEASGDEVDGFGDDDKKKGKTVAGTIKENKSVDVDKASRGDVDDNTVHCLDETDGDCLPPSSMPLQISQQTKLSYQQHGAQPNQPQILQKTNFQTGLVPEGPNTYASGHIQWMCEQRDQMKSQLQKAQREIEEDRKQRQEKKVTSLHEREILKGRTDKQSSETATTKGTHPKRVQSLSKTPTGAKKQQQPATSETMKHNVKRGDNYQRAKKNIDECSVLTMNVSSHSVSSSWTSSTPSPLTSIGDKSSCSMSFRNSDAFQSWYWDQGVHRSCSDGSLDTGWNANLEYGYQHQTWPGSYSSHKTNVSSSSFYSHGEIQKKDESRSYRSESKTLSGQQYGMIAGISQERGRQAQCRRRGSDAGVNLETHRRRSDKGVESLLGKDIPRARSSPSKLGESSPNDRHKKRDDVFFRPWTIDSKPVKKVPSLGTLDLPTSNLSHISSATTSGEEKYSHEGIPSHSNSLPCGDPFQASVFLNPPVSHASPQGGVEKSPIKKRNSISHARTHSDPQKESKYSTANFKDRDTKSTTKRKNVPRGSLNTPGSDNLQDLQTANSAVGQRKTNRRLEFPNAVQEETFVRGGAGGASMARSSEVVTGNDEQLPEGVYVGESSLTSHGPQEKWRKFGTCKNLDEVDVRIQVSDVENKSKILGQRLDQIDQSDDRSCECARIEREILTSARQMFAHLASNRNRADWHMELHKTNTVVEGALRNADEFRLLCRHGRRVTDINPGSVIISIKCLTLTAVVDLCHLQESGDLQKELYRVFSRHVNMEARGITLSVGLSSESVELCKNFFLKAFESPTPLSSKKQSKKKTSPTKRVARSEENLLTTSSSPLSPQFFSRDRSFSSPGLNLHSPLTSPMSVNSPATPTSRRSRKFSFGEINRKAFQELNISDSEPPQSSSKEDLITSSEKSIATSPWRLLSPNMLTSPRHRTSPTTSPLSSPRRLARCDVIHEQENIQHNDT